MHWNTELVRTGDDPLDHDDHEPSGPLPTILEEIERYFEDALVLPLIEEAGLGYLKVHSSMEFDDGKRRLLIVTLECGDGEKQVIFDMETKSVVSLDQVEYQHESNQVEIQSLPTPKIACVLREFLSARNRDDLLEPAIADFQHEHIEAFLQGRHWRARALVILFYIDLIRMLGLACILYLFGGLISALREPFRTSK